MTTCSWRLISVSKELFLSIVWKVLLFVTKKYLETLVIYDFLSILGVCVFGHRAGQKCAYLESYFGTNRIMNICRLEGFTFRYDILSPNMSNCRNIQRISAAISFDISRRRIAHAPKVQTTRSLHVLGLSNCALEFRCFGALYCTKYLCSQLETVFQNGRRLYLTKCRRKSEYRKLRKLCVC